MRFIYTVIYYLSTPYLLVRLWYKSLTTPAYRRRIGERFGFVNPHAWIKPHIWIHTVSLGEVIAATPLIEKLLMQNYSLLITTMTPTGAQRVSQNFTGRAVLHQYIPYDFPLALHKFFQTFTPKIGIIFETELWPNLITCAKQANITLLLFNARLSPKSYKGYTKIRWLIKPILHKFDGIYTQTMADAGRFVNLGATHAKIQTLGNIKFDLQLPHTFTPELHTIKQKLGDFKKIFIAASTHDNEEEQILKILSQLKHAIPNITLLIAPRHPERFITVYQLSIKLGFNTGLRSQVEGLNIDTEVLILDTLGEMLGFYSISDYAFIGGSLIAHGGHNVLEPIAMKIPVLTGKYFYNFQDICTRLLKAKAIIQVDCANDLSQQIISLNQQPNKIHTLTCNASQILQSNQGALLKYFNKTQEALAQLGGEV